MIAGLFCACTETTSQVFAERRRVADMERQRRLFELSPSFICILEGPDHVFAFANQACRQLIGPRDLIGRSARAVFPDVSGQGFFELLDQVYRSGEQFIGQAMPIRIERDHDKPDEELRLNFIYMPLIDETGRLTGIFCQGFDVTQEHLAQEALRESEARLRLALEAGRLAEVTFHIQEGSVTHSPAYARLLGFPSDTILTLEQIRLCYHPEDRERVLRERQAILDGGMDFYEVEKRVVWPDGQVRWIYGRGRVRRDQDGHPLSVIAVYLDDTGRKAAVEGLRISEARLRAVLDAVPVGLVFADAPSGRIIGGNAYAERIFGHPLRFSQDTGHYDEWVCFHPDGRRVASHEYPLSRVIRGEAERPEMEALYEHGNGRQSWIRLIAVPIRSEPGTISGGVVAVLDIDREKRAEEALRELNERLEHRAAEALADRKLWVDVFETSNALIGVLSPDYRFLAINKAYADEFERLFGTRPKPGESLQELLAAMPAERASAMELWQRALRGEEFTVVMEFGDGAWDLTSYEIRFNPLRSRDGETIGAFQYGVDVTERVRSQARLAEAEEALRQSQKLEAMGQLTGGVAHDFNNLLTPIVGSLDLLRRRKLGGEREHRMIDSALQAAERVRVLVQRLLAFTRRQPLQPQPVDVGRLVLGMGELVVSTCGPRVQVEIDVAERLPPAHADANQIEMAILNLAVNARDAMPDGGFLTIAVKLDRPMPGRLPDLASSPHVRLSVTDTGIGMNEATLKRAIEPFFSTKGVGQGTGLGLSMVHGLALQLGGAIDIASSPGLGTRIDLWLPTSAWPAEASRERRTLPVPDTTSMETALVVDDEEAVRASVGMMLSELDYKVVEAGSAEQALDMLRAEDGIGLLITDHLMPGMSGIDLTLTVQAIRPDLRVIIMSGYAELDGVAAGLPRISKPFRHDELAALLASSSTTIRPGVPARSGDAKESRATSA